MPKYLPGNLDPMFSALSDGTRRQVVERLSHGPATVSELARPFAMSLPAFTQHLKVLEQGGLISSEKVGRVRTCYLETAAMEALEGWVGEMRQFWEGRVDALADYAEQLHKQKDENDD